MKKKCPNNERNNPENMGINKDQQPTQGDQLPVGGAGATTASETTPVKKPVSKSKIVKDAMNTKKIEAIKEEEEEDNVGVSQVLTAKKI